MADAEKQFVTDVEAALTKYKATQTPAPIPVTDDKEGTFVTEAGKTLRWQGELWGFSAEGKVVRNGRPATDPDHTSNVVKVGIRNGRLVQVNSARQIYGWTGQPDWEHLGEEASGPQPTPAPTPVPPAPTPPAPPPTSGYVKTNPPGEVRRWLKAHDGKSIKVPMDFVGMHFTMYPKAPKYVQDEIGVAGSPKAPFEYGAVRNMGYAEAGSWWAMDVGYNESETTERRNWSMMDEYYAVNAADGKKGLHTFWGTPKKLAIKEYSDPSYKFPSWPGCQYAPKNAAAFDKLEKFVKDTITRYKGKIRYAESSNEPDPEQNIPEKDNFFVGMKTALSEVQLRTYRGAKAADPTVIVVGPGTVMWDSWDNAVAHPYLKSQLEAKNSSGNRCVDSMDMLSVHYYDRWDTDPDEYRQFILAMKATLASVGKPTMPIIDSEHAIIDNTSWDDNKKNALASKIKKHLALGAALEIQGVYLYAADGGFKGKGTNNLACPVEGGAVAIAIDAAAKALPGAEIFEAAQLVNGAIWLSGLKGGKAWSVTY